MADDDPSAQDRDFLARGGSPWPASALPTAPPAPVAKGPRNGWFGDPRRPRALAFPAMITAAAFPISWVAWLLLASLGGSASENDAEGLDKAHFVVVLAAIVPVIGLVAMLVDWRTARRSYPREDRALRAEGADIGWGIAAVLLVAVTSLFAFFLWTTPL